MLAMDNVIYRSLEKYARTVDLDKYIDVRKILEDRKCPDRETQKKVKLILHRDNINPDDYDYIRESMNIFSLPEIYNMHKLGMKQICESVIIDDIIDYYNTYKYYKYYVKRILRRTHDYHENFMCCIEKLYEIGLFNDIVALYKRLNMWSSILVDIARANITNINYVRRIIQAFSYKQIFDEYCEGGFDIKVMKYLHRYHKEGLANYVSKSKIYDCDPKYIIFLERHKYNFSYPNRVNCGFALIIRKFLGRCVNFDKRDCQILLIKKITQKITSRNLTKLILYHV